jgi:arsenite oxidase large subunit
VTYERLRAMGTNGFQEPAVGFEDGKIVGTKRLYTDAKFSTKDQKAHFFETQWRGFAAAGKDEQKAKFKYLINNGRTNHVWQSAYLDVQNDLVMDRWPYPFIQISTEDMNELGVKAGDLVEVYNDEGSTQAMVYPTPTARKGDTFMLFAYPMGVMGNVINEGTNDLIIPNYKQTWANIRKIADAPESVAHLTFKSEAYSP